jgi:hypothetical protein
MPANRNTGATASWMICATVVTEVGEVGNIAVPIARNWPIGKLYRPEKA